MDRAKPKLMKSKEQIQLEKRIEELEKKVAALEGQTPEPLKLKNDYALDFGKPRLLKPKLTRRLLNYFK